MCENSSRGTPPTLHLYLKILILEFVSVAMTIGKSLRHSPEPTTHTVPKACLRRTGAEASLQRHVLLLLLMPVYTCLFNAAVSSHQYQICVASWNRREPSWQMSVMSSGMDVSLKVCGVNVAFVCLHCEASCLVCLPAGCLSASLTSCQTINLCAPCHLSFLMPENTQVRSPFKRKKKKKPKTQHYAAEQNK